MSHKMWFLILLVLQVVHLGSTTLQQTGSQPRRRCYLCSGAPCRPKTSALCPPETPHCATIAESPNFYSSLTCAALSTTPCIITFIGHKDLKMKCVCDEDLCNEPFTELLRSHLLNVTKHAANYTTQELTSLIEYSTKFPNATHLYKHFSVQITPSENKNSTKTKGVQPIEPRAEALKHEPTPSDDDEDESEGSGSYEESRSRLAPSPPANPSSYLPANANKAVPLFVTSFLATTSLFLLIIA